MPSREVAEQYFQRAIRGQYCRALACFSPDAEFVMPAGRLPFPDGVRAYLEGFQESFPGNSFEIANVLEAGDEVAIEGSWIGRTQDPCGCQTAGPSLPRTRKLGRRSSRCFGRATV